MAGKYAHLKGRIPERPGVEEPTPVQEAMKKYAGLSLDDMTAHFATLTDERAKLDEQSKALKVQLDALDALILKEMTNGNIDSMRMNGYTWFEGCVPYPIAEDPAAIVKYFKENGMEDQLQLSITELTARLKMFVRAEAENNELQIDVKEGPDGTTVTEVRSQIPGVKVFLDRSVNRRKAAASKE